MVLYGPVPSSRRGLHFLSNTVAFEGITNTVQGKEQILNICKKDIHDKLKITKTKNPNIKDAQRN